MAADTASLVIPPSNTVQSGVSPTNTAALARAPSASSLITGVGGGGGGGGGGASAKQQTTTTTRFYNNFVQTESLEKIAKDMQIIPTNEQHPEKNNLSARRHANRQAFKRLKWADKNVDSGAVSSAKKPGGQRSGKHAVADGAESYTDDADDDTAATDIDAIDEIKQTLTDPELSAFRHKSLNPFRLPKTIDIFTYRERVRAAREVERKRNLNRPAHTKTTFASRQNRIRSKVNEVLKEARRKANDVVDEEQAYSKTTAGQKERDFHQSSSDAALSNRSESSAKRRQRNNIDSDPVYALAVTRKNRYIYRESKWDLRERVREMALRNFTMWVKREQISKLDETKRVEEQRIETIEKRLERDAAMFDRFLKDNDRASVEAIKEAETETKRKQELVAQVKLIQAKINTVKSQVAHLEEKLGDLQGYAKFLTRIIPQCWLPVVAAQKQEFLRKRKLREAVALAKTTTTSDGKLLSGGCDRKEAEREQKRARIMLEIVRMIDDAIDPGATRRAKMMGVAGAIGVTAQKEIAQSELPTITPAAAPQENTTITSARKPNLNQIDQIIVQKLEEIESPMNDTDTDQILPPLVFSTPAQLLFIFRELEERCLSIINNSQDTEEELESLERKKKKVKDDMESELTFIKTQCEEKEKQIKHLNELRKDLETKAKLFSHGEYNPQAQEKLLREAKDRVEQVYERVVGENEAHLDAEQMLMSLEHHLEAQLDKIEQFKPEVIAYVQGLKDKEKRAKEKGEKLRKAKEYADARQQRALERLMAAPSKQHGRPLMWRSKPPDAGSTRHKNSPNSSRQDDELEDIDLDGLLAE